jgi:hypothetical protein
MERRSFKLTVISEEHLLPGAEKIRLKAESLPHGTEREELLTRARDSATRPRISRTG